MPRAATASSSHTGIADLRTTLAGDRLPALDGLRAVSVCAVMWFHFGYRFGITWMPGELGVDMFFSLSGFLITWMLLREYHESGGISVRGFYARRILRIFPAYYVYLLFTFAVDRFYAHVVWKPALGTSALFYVVNYYVATGHSAGELNHLWSLAVEEQFYLLWPITLVWLLRGGQRRVIQGLTAVIVFVIVWRGSLFAIWGPRAGDWMSHAFDSRVDNLAVGCLLAVMVRYDAVLDLARASAKRAWYPLVTFALLIGTRVSFEDPHRFSVRFTLYGVLMAILIVQLMQLHQSALWRWLSHPVTVYVGRVSYAVYLYHIWGEAAGRRLVAYGPFVSIPISMIASVGLASISYYVVERPAMSFRKRIRPRVARAAS